MREREGASQQRQEKREEKRDGSIRIGQMNLNKLTRPKFERLQSLLQDNRVDIFIGGETHLARTKAAHYLSSNTEWTVWRADFEDVEKRPERGARRGGVLIMVKTILGIKVSKISRKHGLMAVLSMTLKRKDWDRDLQLCAVYRSPSSPTDIMQEQFAVIEEALTGTGAGGKSTIQIVAGDLNAHTGTVSEGLHIHAMHPIPPPRWGDPSPHRQPRGVGSPTAGDLLLDVMEKVEGIIVTNRLQKPMGDFPAGKFTRIPPERDLGEEGDEQGPRESVIDYFLMRAEWFQAVTAEGIAMNSGAYLHERCDHEFLFMDVRPYLSSKKRGPLSTGVEWHAPIKRPFYGTKALVENKHSDRTRKASLVPDSLPRDAYQAALSRISKELEEKAPSRSNLNQGRVDNGDPWMMNRGGRISSMARIRSSQERVDEMFTRMLRIFDRALTETVGKTMPPEGEPNEEGKTSSRGGTHKRDLNGLEILKTSPPPRVLQQPARELEQRRRELNLALRSGASPWTVRQGRRALHEASAKYSEELENYIRVRDKETFYKVAHGDLRFKPGGCGCVFGTDHRIEDGENITGRGT